MDIREFTHYYAHSITGEYKRCGNVYCEDGVIYSYGSHYPMARRFSDDVYFITHDVLPSHERRSATTGKHVAYVAGALAHKKVIPVRDVTADTVAAHDSNVDSMLEDCRDMYERAVRERTCDFYGKELWRLARGVIDYCEAVKSRRRSLRNATPAQVLEKAGCDVDRLEAKRAENKKRAEERAAKEMKSYEEKLADKLPRWRRGELARLPYPPMPLSARMPFYLRLSPDGPFVETSGGAKVGMRHARRLYDVARNIVQNRLGDRDFAEHDFRCGPYKLNYVYANGDVKVGCHYIKFDEMSNLYEQLKANGGL